MKEVTHVDRFVTHAVVVIGLDGEDNEEGGSHIALQGGHVVCELSPQGATTTAAAIAVRHNHHSNSK